MQPYLGAKIIKAEPMSRNEFGKERGGEIIDSGNDKPGYHVAYPDPKGGEYHSWSPKAVFEEAYRPLNPGETEFIINPKKEA